MINVPDKLGRQLVVGDRILLAQVNGHSYEQGWLVATIEAIDPEPTHRGYGHMTHRIKVRPVCVERHSWEPEDKKPRAYWYSYPSNTLKLDGEGVEWLLSDA